MSSTIYFNLSSLEKVEITQIPKTVPKRVITLMFTRNDAKIVISRLLEQGPKAKKPVYNWNGPDSVIISANKEPHLCFQILETLYYLSVASSDTYVTEAKLKEFKNLYKPKSLKPISINVKTNNCETVKTKVGTKSTSLFSITSKQNCSLVTDHSDRAKPGKNRVNTKLKSAR